MWGEPLPLAGACPQRDSNPPYHLEWVIRPIWANLREHPRIPMNIRLEPRSSDAWHTAACGRFQTFGARMGHDDATAGLRITPGMSFVGAGRGVSWAREDEQHGGAGRSSPPLVRRPRLASGDGQEEGDVSRMKNDA